MNILVIGATGRLGRLLVEYALDQGHHVTGFARNFENYPISHENLTCVVGDVLYPSLINKAMKGKDIVLTVIGIRQFRGPITLLSTGIKNVIDAMKARKVKRILTITGAGILQENEEVLLMDSLSFPPNLLNISMDHLRVFEALKASGLDWTIAVPAFMHGGERTGKYLVKSDYYPPKSLNEVSVEDVADFMVKEMTENKFVGKRVGIAHPKDF